MNETIGTVIKIIESCTSFADRKHPSNLTDYERGMCTVRDAVFTYLLEIEKNEKKAS